MDIETIDESPNALPAEAIIEIKSMAKWMTFTSVVLIIFTILQILGNLVNVSSDSNPVFFISLAFNLLNLYIGFMVVRKAGLFNAFAENHNETTLLEAMKLNKTYWLISSIILISSIVLTMISR